MLSKFVQENKESWDSFLDTCTFAYNTFRHESTLHTPFEVMFGRQAVLPIDLDMEKLSPERLLQEYEDTSADQPGKEIAAITTLRQALLQQVKNNIAKAQKRPTDGTPWDVPHCPYIPWGLRNGMDNWDRGLRMGLHGMSLTVCTSLGD